MQSNQTFSIASHDFQLGILTILVSEISQWTFQDVLTGVEKVRERLGLEKPSLDAAVTGPDADGVLLIIGTGVVNRQQFEEHKAVVERNDALRNTLLAAIEAVMPTPAHTADELLEAAKHRIESHRITHDDAGGEHAMQATIEAFNAVTGSDLTEAEGWAFLLLNELAVSRQGGPFMAKHYTAMASLAGLAGEAEAKRQRQVASADDEVTA